MVLGINLLSKIVSMLDGASTHPRIVNYRAVGSGNSAGSNPALTANNINNK